MRRFIRWLLNKDELEAIRNELQRNTLELRGITELLARSLGDRDDEDITSPFPSVSMQTIGAIGPIKNKVRNQSRA
jgi:hypothetical protein